MVDSILLQNILDRLEEIHKNTADTAQRVTRVETNTQDIPERVLMLEKFQTRVATVGSVAAFVFSSALAVIGLKH